MAKNIHENIEEVSEFTGVPAEYLKEFEKSIKGKVIEDYDFPDLLSIGYGINSGVPVVTIEEIEQDSDGKLFVKKEIVLKADTLLKGFATTIKRSAFIAYTKVSMEKSCIDEEIIKDFIEEEVKKTFRHTEKDKEIFEMLESISYPSDIGTMIKNQKDEEKNE